MEKGLRSIRKGFLEHRVFEEQRDDRSDLDPELFPRLPAKRVLDAFVRLDSSAREGPLPGKDTTIGRHLAEEDSPVAGVDERNDDQARPFGKTHRIGGIPAIVRCCREARRLRVSTGIFASVSAFGSVARAWPGR